MQARIEHDAEKRGLRPSVIIEVIKDLVNDIADKQKPLPFVISITLVLQVLFVTKFKRVKLELMKFFLHRSHSPMVLEP